MKKKVLLLGKLPPPYMGPAVATEIILNSDLKNRFDLIHLDTRSNVDLRTMGKLSFGKIKRYFSIYTKMVSLLRKSKPDLVIIPISQSFTGFFKDSLFILLARLFGVKTLLHLRGSNFRTFFNSLSRIRKAYIKSFLRRTAGVIVLGEKLRPIFAGLYPDDRIFICPNGGNFAFPEKAFPGDQTHVLYLANLQPSKGIEDVIEAVNVLKRQSVSGFELDVVGAWRNEVTKRHCLEQVEKNSLPVTFHSPDGNKLKFGFLSGADIFVFTPREPEGHPWVIVEALAAGLPVISTDQGAITESVINGENGFIVPDRSPEVIADKLKLLLTDKNLRQKMSKRSRAFYEEKFTEGRMVDRLTDIINQVLRS